MCADVSAAPCYLDFKAGHPAGEVLLDWHRRLADRARGDRAARADLRRARTVDEVFLVPMVHRLRHELRPWVFSDDMLARVAMVVADIEAGEADPDLEFGTVLARSGVNPDRVRLLANTEDLELFLRLLRGLLDLVKRGAPVLATAELVRCWHFPASRRYARRQLLIKFFEEALETDNA